MCQLKKIRSKPNLHFRDFSIWPPFDISNIFYKLCSTRLLVWVLLLYSPSFMSIAYLWLFEIFYRNPTSTIFKMAVVPAKFNFQIGSIAEDVLHDLYYNYAKFHALTTLWAIVLKICTDRLDYKWKLARSYLYSETSENRLAILNVW